MSSDELVHGPGGVSLTPSITASLPREGYTLSQMIQRVREVLRPRTNNFAGTGTATGLTLAQMRARVRQVLRDDNASFITDAEITDWLNEGLLELASRTHAIQARAAGTTTGNTIALPADYLGQPVLQIDGKPVQFTDDDEEWNDWRDQSATPPRTVARIAEGIIELWPDPGPDLAYRLEYVKAPRLLSADGDKTDLPPTLQVRAINYARANGAWKEQAILLGDRYMQVFSAGLGPGEQDMPPDMKERYAPAPRDIQDFEIIDWLNEALLDIAWREEPLVQRAEGTTSGTSGITLPEDFIKAEHLRLGVTMPDGTSRVEFVSNVDDFLWWKFESAMANPPHTIGRVIGSVIELYPLPDAGTSFALEYVARPKVLILGTDKPNVPVVLQAKAIFYARAQAIYAQAQGRMDTEMGDRYMQMYTLGLHTPSVQERSFAGPMQLIPVPGPFDTLDAKHW